MEKSLMSQIFDDIEIINQKIKNIKSNEDQINELIRQREMKFKEMRYIKLNDEIRIDEQAMVKLRHGVHTNLSDAYIEEMNRTSARIKDAKIESGHIYAELESYEGQLRKSMADVEVRIQECQSDIKDISGHLSDVSFGYNFPNDAPMEIRENQSNALRSTLHLKESELASLMEKRDAIRFLLPKEKFTNSQTNPSISEVTINRLYHPINSTVAVCSVTFYNTLTINGITINEGSNGLYVRMPQKRTKQGNYIDVAHPLSREGRTNINQTLLTAYNNDVYHQSFFSPNPQSVSAQNSVRYPADYGNSLARLDIVVDDMVVHNAKIINSNDTPRLFLPTYKTKDGKYTSICAPANSQAYSEFNQKALNEFNADYTFRKFSDEQVEALKGSDVKYQARKNDSGDNLVKFKTEDLQKVNAVVYPKNAAVKH